MKERPSRSVDWFDSLVGYFAVTPVSGFAYWHVPPILREIPDFYPFLNHAGMLAVPMFWYAALRRRFPIGGLRWSELRGWVWPCVALIAFSLAVFTSLYFAGLGAGLKQMVDLSPVGFIFEATAPGLGEEFLWRGLIQTGLNASIPLRLRIFRFEIGTGTILASLGFGAAHLGNVGQPFVITLVQAGGATIVGLILGTAYDRTKNLWGAVIAHNLSDLVIFGIIALISR